MRIPPVPSNSTFLLSYLNIYLPKLVQEINNIKENPLIYPIDAKNQVILNVADPMNNTDAANKSYVDSHTSSGNIELMGSILGAGPLDSPIITTLSPTQILTSKELTFDWTAHTGGVTLDYRLPVQEGNSSSFETRFSNSDGYKWSMFSSVGTATRKSAGITFVYQEPGVFYPITPLSMHVYEDVAGKFAILSLGGNFKQADISYITANNTRITNIGTPIEAKDAVNKSYVDGIAGDKGVQLTGAVTGSGLTGSPIATSFSLPMNLQNNRLINLATPINGSDAATKSYADSIYPSIPSTILRGNSTQSWDYRPAPGTFAQQEFTLDDYNYFHLRADMPGLGKSSIIEMRPNGPGNYDRQISFLFKEGKTLVSTVKTMTVSYEGADMHGYPIKDVAAPVRPGDAANKSYVDSQGGGGSISLTGAIEGTGSLGSPISTTLSPIQTLGSRELTFDWTQQLYGGFEHKMPVTPAGTDVFYNTIVSNIDGYKWAVSMSPGTDTRRSSMFSVTLFEPESSYPFSAITAQVYENSAGKVANISLGGNFNKANEAFITVNGNRIVQVGTPKSSLDAANKSYVDNQVNLMSKKIDLLSASHEEKSQKIEALEQALALLKKSTSKNQGA